MKTIQREKTIVNTYDVYVANDGTEFNDKAECEKYEKSAIGVVNARYKALVVDTHSEYSAFQIGCDDNLVQIVKVRSEKDIDTVVQMFMLIERCDIKSDRVGEAEKIVRRAFEENDILFVNRGYDDDCFWLMGTCNSLKEGIDSLAKECATKND